MCAGGDKALCRARDGSACTRIPSNLRLIRASAAALAGDCADGGVIVLSSAESTDASDTDEERSGPDTDPYDSYSGVSDEEELVLRLALAESAATALAGGQRAAAAGATARSYPAQAPWQIASNAGWEAPRWPDARSSGGQSAEPARPACRYGAQCYRQSPGHRRQCAPAADPLLCLRLRLRSPNLVAASAHICLGTGLVAAHICTGIGLAPAISALGIGLTPSTSTLRRGSQGFRTPTIAGRRAHMRALLVLQRRCRGGRSS
jgi:hypothetical protein